ncbi:hypothetical protein GH714_005968 [Hevea brasiliensis]|uniref:DUF3741 domain-containing protein n=1 Tax=Hevea brasiliensis TaxID=3981 RepID=A0A6A6LES6_HEVBR|nr:hypothetical protein GH714_005968 [Hevea brasiliensis]
MAKRSDFAQKLLDDLRVRKERMSASQSSKSSKPITADAYSYSKQAYRGSREMKTHQTTALINGSTCHKSTGGNRSFSIGEASKQIVPFGRGRSSEQIGDLSMALAFALENGGKLRRMDSSGNSSVLGFLNQIGRRSVDMAKIERSSIDRHSSATSRFPTLSHLHIKEISKGAQKLNQILKACSNGVNFDRYSIEIVRELLKGAMDLEESLRMLVNLQEASEYMISPQSKTRITLLDDDEDDNDIIVKTDENKQLARPIFSFDKPSRNSHYIHEAARTDLKQRLMALTYKSETTNFGHDNHTLRTLNSQRRSASHNPNVKNLMAFSEHKKHSSPSILKPENGRIPNVIAKLMGLEELPENDDSKYITKKESSSKGKTERIVAKKTAEVTHERKTKDAGTLGSDIRKHKQMQPNQIQLTQDTTHSLHAERNLASQHASFEGTSHHGKLLQKDVEGIKPMRSSNKVNMKIGKHQSNIDQPSQRIGSRKDIQEKERKQDNPKLREQKGKEKGETKVLKQQLQQMTHQTLNGSEAAIVLQGQAECNLTMLKTEMRDAHMLLSNNQAKSANNLAFQQQQMLQNFESLDIKHHAVDNEHQNIKQKIQVRRQIRSESRSLPKKYPHTSQAITNNGSSTESTGTMQSMGFPNRWHHGDLVQDKNSPNFNVTMQDSMDKNSNQNMSPRNLNSEVMKEKNITTIPPVMEEKPVHLTAVQKVKVTKVQKAMAPRKIDELPTRRSGNPHNLARPLKHQTSMLQEVKQKRHNRLGQSKEEERVRSNRSKEAEAGIKKSNKSVSSTRQPNMVEELQSQPEQASNLCIPPTDDECQSLKGPEILAPNENSSSVINDQQGYDPDFGIGKHKSHSIVLDPLNRTHEGKIVISYPQQLENQKVSELETLEPLTESENHLKHILIKSQLFLNTAEALFKLNIPPDILHAGGHDCHDEESKLILDCGYELHKDFEKLKYKAECIIEDYLPKMLELDVYNRDLDVNCMWDFGWHEMMFTFLEKDDVIRDVERHVLNALLDEVTRDLVLLFWLH